MVYVIDCVNLSLTPKRPEINSYKTELSLVKTGVNDHATRVLAPYNIRGNRAGP